MPAMTRGPLPPGIYWRRRVFVGLLALSIVFVVASALGVGSDGSSGEAPVAQQAGAAPTHTVTAPTATASPQASEQKKQKQQDRQKQQKQQKATQQPAPLAKPTGTCVPADILVAPTTQRAVAGRTVTLTLSLRTRTTAACYWRVNHQRLAVRISRGGDEIWSTRHCKDGIPAQQVILRRDVATEVTLPWDARKSDEGCPEATDWVLPGSYVVTAAVFGGEPQQRTLSLVAPKATPSTPKPTPKPTGKPTQRAGQTQAPRGD